MSKINKTASETDRERIKEAARAYKKAWRAKNKEKIKAANERFYLKKARELAEAEQKKTV